MMNDLISTEAKWRGVLNDFSATEILTKPVSKMEATQNKDYGVHSSVRSSSAMLAKTSNYRSKTTTLHGQSNAKNNANRKKLPFSFLVANEKRGVLKGKRGQSNELLGENDTLDINQSQYSSINMNYSLMQPNAPSVKRPMTGYITNKGMRATHQRNQTANITNFLDEKLVIQNSQALEPNIDTYIMDDRKASVQTIDKHGHLVQQ